ncbi:hypothetical protein DRN85_03680 [Methanosarcinales archaeon]|nr:MAG: hypothetical protein DRN85_03680 [Methanosarcinales archaeon]
MQSEKEWRDFKMWASKAKSEEALKVVAALVWIVQDLRDTLKLLDQRLHAMEERCGRHLCKCAGCSSEHSAHHTMQGSGGDQEDGR